APLRGKPILLNYRRLSHRRSMAPSAVPLPAQQQGAPGEAAAHRLEQDEIALLDASIGPSDRERQRDRRRRRIAVLFHGADDLFWIDAELVGRAGDDALIGLMRHEPVD